MSAFLTSADAMALLFAAVRQAQRHLERGKVMEAQNALHDAEEAVEQAMADYAEDTEFDALQAEIERELAAPLPVVLMPVGVGP